MQLKSDQMESTPPWGSWEVLLVEPSYKVKRITVHAGHRMSYQKHDRRSEHWFVLQGTALVTINDEELEVPKGNAIDIPRETPHRIKNIGPDPLVFIEIQTGDYFGEDDNTRLQDDYGRA